MIPYHSIINSEEERIAKSMVKEQHKYYLEKNFYSRINIVSKGIGVDIKVAEKLRKSARKKLIHGNIQKRL